jgi:hypothetical protein
VRRRVSLPHPTGDQREHCGDLVGLSVLAPNLGLERPVSDQRDRPEAVSVLEVELCFHTVHT